MARQLRHHHAGGWYHITSRGMGRQAIYADDADRVHFLDLLVEAVGRYGLVLHAYVLMDNHYHLLIESPAGNVSRAMQWLNLSHAAWFNARHGRSGPLFQARFGSVPVEDGGAWAEQCGMYIHLNPVRVAALGLSKADRAASREGLPDDTPEAVLRLRLAVLRTYRWSSYRAYAGYASAQEWLACATLLTSAGGVRAEYRRQAEGAVAHSVREGAGARLSGALAIGGTEFVRRVRAGVLGRPSPGSNARAWRRLLPFGEITRAVAGVRSPAGADASVRRRDNGRGRDIALWLGRRHCALTLAELGEHTGMSAHAVSKAISRMSHLLVKERSLQYAIRKIEAEIRRFDDDVSKV